MLRTLDNIAGRVIALSAILGTLGLIAEVVVILIDVTGRYFGSPLRGAQDCLIDLTAQVLVQGRLIVRLDHFRTHHQRSASCKIARDHQLQPVRDRVIVLFAEEDHIGIGHGAQEFLVRYLLAFCIEQLVGR